jgi:hypothetical protein
MEYAGNMGILPSYIVGCSLTYPGLSGIRVNGDLVAFPRTFDFWKCRVEWFAKFFPSLHMVGPPLRR